jgi:hypothetical protein
MRLMSAWSKTSPLKAAPLRNPGQSIDDEIYDVWDDVEPTVVVTILLLNAAGLEWWRWYTAAPPNPMMWTAAAVLAVVFAGWRMIRARKRVRQLRLARDGERAVGQFLEGLREDGFRVVHDVRGEQFNVDHVLVGPKGVFTVETKTCSKPAKGKPVVQYDGESVTVNGFKPERDPVTQAKAQARWLQELIRESTGRSVEIRPAVVYPGWFVSSPKGGERPDVWVLNPKALPKFLENEPDRLTTEDAGLVAYHLSRYIRARAVVTL